VTGGYGTFVNERTPPSHSSSPQLLDHFGSNFVHIDNIFNITLSPHNHNLPWHLSAIKLLHPH
jgi:hypothetical protein